MGLVLLLSKWGSTTIDADRDKIDKGGHKRRHVWEKLGLFRGKRPRVRLIVEFHHLLKYAFRKFEFV